MRAHELLERRRLRGVRPADRGRLEQAQEVLAGRDREEGQRVGDDIHLAAVGQGEAHRHAVRVGVGVAVRDRRQPGGIREAHGHRHLAAAEQGRGAELRPRLARHEAALGHDPLGVIGPKAGMPAEQLVHGVDDLLRDRRLVGPGRCLRGQCQCQGGRGGAERAMHGHGGVPDRAVPPPIARTPARGKPVAVRAREGDRRAIAAG